MIDPPCIVVNPDRPQEYIWFGGLLDSNCSAALESLLPKLGDEVKSVSRVRNYLLVENGNPLVGVPGLEFIIMVPEVFNVLLFTLTLRAGAGHIPSGRVVL